MQIGIKGVLSSLLAFASKNEEARELALLTIDLAENEMPNNTPSIGLSFAYETMFWLQREKERNSPSNI
jgi:hypothetical protein